MIWPTDPPASDLDDGTHGRFCRCLPCERAWLEDIRELRAADRADVDREEALEDAGADAGMLDGDIDF